MKRIEGYTKGPWEISTKGGRTISSVIIVDGESCYGSDVCDVEDTKDAELIASAPETYERCVAYEEALREMMAAIPKEPPTDMAEALRWHERQVEAVANVEGLLLDNGIAVVSPLRMGKGCVVQLPTHGE